MTATATDPRDGTATVTGGAVAAMGTLVLDQAGFPVLDQAGGGMS